MLSEYHTTAYCSIFSPFYLTILHPILSFPFSHHLHPSSDCVLRLNDQWAHILCDNYATRDCEEQNGFPETRRCHRSDERPHSFFYVLLLKTYLFVFICLPPLLPTLPNLLCFSHPLPHNKFLPLPLLLHLSLLLSSISYPLFFSHIPLITQFPTHRYLALQGSFPDNVSHRRQRRYVLYAILYVYVGQSTIKWISPIVLINDFLICRNSETLVRVPSLLPPVWGPHGSNVHVRGVAQKDIL
jgi:hypothetical protein